MGMLNGKVAIVTGAGTGLGRSHTLALAAEGATVVVNNRVSDPGARPSAELVAEEVARAGGEAVVDTCTVTDWDAVGSMVAQTVDRFGRLDIVVNNAGVLEWELIADIAEPQFDAVMEINFKGTFALTHHACRHWRAAGAADGSACRRIINVASGVGLFGFPRGGLYGASKAATISMTMVCAMEMRPYGVTANLIWPEARTRMGKGIFPDAPEDGSFDSYDPANISPLVTYLASDRAEWLTGQVIYIQGNRIWRMSSWRVAGEYTTADGGRFTVGELGHALPMLYGTLPTLQPETSLQDAMIGIDPAITGGR
jgi:NAD(P)-dependent dehydrogenase (short-subunit alcohol dehydrogenase family)